MIVIMVEHSAKEAAGGTGNVAARRRALRLSQAELATRCGVSRQFINLLEAGRTQPNVQLAMMLARVLGGTVEELFAGEPERLELDGGNVLGDVRPVAGTRVVVGRVNGRWVTHVADTLDSLGGGFTPADGVVSVTDGQPRIELRRTFRQLEGNVIVAGCDPSLGLLRGLRAGAGEDGGRVCWVNASSSRALQMLADGLAHVVGVHFGEEDGAENLRRVRQLDAGGRWEVLRFSRWEQGWMCRPEVARRFRGTEDLGLGRLRLINREEGSGMRLWITEQLVQAGVRSEGIKGFDVAGLSHWECARQLLEGRGDVAAGPRVIAEAFGLNFIAVDRVAFDLVVPRALLDHGPVAALLDAVRGGGFQRDLAMLSGYEAAGLSELRRRA